MTSANRMSIVILLLGASVMSVGCATKKIKRIGMVIGIKPEKIAEYKELHADSNHGVRDLLSKYHMHNFTIFLKEIDGKYY